MNHLLSAVSWHLLIWNVEDLDRLRGPLQQFRNTPELCAMCRSCSTDLSFYRFMSTFHHLPALTDTETSPEE